MRTCTHTNANKVENVNTLAISICEINLYEPRDIQINFWMISGVSWRQYLEYVECTKQKHKSQDGKPKSKNSLLFANIGPEVVFTKQTTFDT
jgi:hypothetical protein